MMFLIKKKDKINIVGQNEIQYLIKYGWDIVKPLIALPYSIKSMRCDARSPDDIRHWYYTKIKEAKLKHDKYVYELDKFNRIMKEK